MKFDFLPFGVCDSQNRLLIADYGNKCIHLVNNEGRFLVIIHRDNLAITSCTLTQNDLSFVSYEERKMKVIKLAVKCEVLERSS